MNMPQAAARETPRASQGVRLSEYKSQSTHWYRAKRLLWAFVQFPFWPKMPRMLSPARIFLLRLFGARIGRNCRVDAARVWAPWNLEMSEWAVIGGSAEIYNLAPVKIGANSVISQRAYLCTATHDYSRADFPLVSKPITIESSAWIAAGAFVAPGVRVGEGAIVGACSVVTKNVPAWMICAGNPCRPIRPRVLNGSR
jgi:putative colanic acid biosynthesis acetyltransferase WcaF